MENAVDRGFPGVAEGRQGHERHGRTRKRAEAEGLTPALANESHESKRMRKAAETAEIRSDSFDSLAKTLVRSRFSSFSCLSWTKFPASPEPHPCPWARTTTL